MISGHVVVHSFLGGSQTALDDSVELASVHEHVVEDVHVLLPRRFCARICEMDVAAVDAPALSVAERLQVLLRAELEQRRCIFEQQLVVRLQETPVLADSCLSGDGTTLL